jgi:hypothetical protein
LAEDITSPGLDLPVCARFFTGLFDGHAVTAILRGTDPATTLTICQKARHAGILVTEVAAQAGRVLQGALDEDHRD